MPVLNCMQASSSELGITALTISMTLQYGPIPKSFLSGGDQHILDALCLSAMIQ